MKIQLILFGLVISTCAYRFWRVEVSVQEPQTLIKIELPKALSETYIYTENRGYIVKDLVLRSGFPGLLVEVQEYDLLPSRWTMITGLKSFSILTTPNLTEGYPTFSLFSEHEQSYEVNVDPFTWEYRPKPVRNSVSQNILGWWETPLSGPIENLLSLKHSGE